MSARSARTETSHVREGRTMKHRRSPAGVAVRLQEVREAAQNQDPIAGLTHPFYRYPGRFSPQFARSVIEAFSSRGDLVFDPYMGGGTSLVEALALGRRAAGCDLNSLAVFVTRVKTNPLNRRERDSVLRWASMTVPGLNYRDQLLLTDDHHERHRRNLDLPQLRPIRKMIGLALASIEELPTGRSRDFARCALLNVGQWALNGRKRLPTLREFRTVLCETAVEMLSGIDDFSANVADKDASELLVEERDAAALQDWQRLRDAGSVDLIVTSPPYPRIHMLYHRWQVDGRKETGAPYWIAACQDGEGAAFYGFADHRPSAEDRYFARSLETLRSVRSVARAGAFFVQLLAFSDPERQVRRYLRNMGRAGFEEVRDAARGRRHRRIWRSVPGRRWHASLKGDLCSAREVVLVHRAV